jgi:preprotein translocase subunit SecB
MSDIGPEGTAPEGVAAPDSNTAPQFGILAQYVRDLSFENPNAPASLAAGRAPQIEVGVDVRAQNLGEERFEIELKINATARHEDRVAFVVELSYAGLFAIRNVPQESLQPLCLIEGPRILFPFARRVLADATRDGGFPPLLLDPIDFAALFRQMQAQGQGQG